MLGWFKRLLGSAEPKNRSQLNDFVREQLRKHGDTGIRKRMVTHYCYPVTENSAPAEAITQFLAKDGFDVTPAQTTSGLILRRRDKTARGEFDALTVRLESYLSTLGWDYDGWETEIRRDDDKDD